ncbi:hypothetical protein Acr_10g0000040 [Actinidia rufa]|uniref:Uncharacterized protein n=1 Tax=Actinidia rufa TaxID=165716 RepID=A0A7J0F8V3_9ERIC|nr:hypothetical protein Acr_10g0000040 [Actinidia rufa]
MEGESRKRKMENEEDEEEEMEKFFALVRSTKDVRERLNKSQEGEKKKGEEEKPVRVWNPSFQPEDFMKGCDTSKGPQASLAGLSKREDETKEEYSKGGGGGDRLDLNLSL